jgi:hypothetical protein
MPEVTLSGGCILTTLAVILIVLESISILSKGIEGWKSLTGKNTRQREMRDVHDRIISLENRMSSAEHRLDQGNRRFAETTNDTTETLLALKGIIQYLRNGSDESKLQAVETKLDKYLIEKKGIKLEDV